VDVTCSALEFLTSVVSGDDTVDAVIQAGGIDLLCAALVQYTDDAAVRKQGRGLLQQLLTPLIFSGATAHVDDAVEDLLEGEPGAASKELYTHIHRHTRTHKSDAGHSTAVHSA
jgi:hypothetical protein